MQTQTQANARQKTVKDIIQYKSEGKPHTESEIKRHTLTKAQWDEIKELAEYTPERGPKPENMRHTFNAIFWKIATGVPWRDLPREFGPWQTVYTRFRALMKHGIFDKILLRLQRLLIRKKLL